jgi:hypothetical protein
MDSKCGYLVVSVGVLSWAETMYYRCSFHCVETMCCVPTMGGSCVVPGEGVCLPGFLCAGQVHLDFSVGEKNVLNGVSATCDMFSCFWGGNKWYLHMGGWCPLQVIVGV